MILKLSWGQTNSSEIHPLQSCHVTRRLETRAVCWTRLWTGFWWCSYSRPREAWFWPGFVWFCCSCVTLEPDGVSWLRADPVKKEELWFWDHVTPGTQTRTGPTMRRASWSWPVFCVWTSLKSAAQIHQDLWSVTGLEGLSSGPSGSPAVCTKSPLDSVSLYQHHSDPKATSPWRSVTNQRLSSGVWRRRHVQMDYKHGCLSQNVSWDFNHINQLLSLQKENPATPSWTTNMAALMSVKNN